MVVSIALASLASMIAALDNPPTCEMKAPCVCSKAIRNGEILADATAVPEHVNAARPLFSRRPHMMGFRPCGHDRRHDRE
jgi:hypothetical protein